MTSSSHESPSRRRFLGAGLTCLAVASGLSTTLNEAAAESALPKVSAQDANAKALGYVHDAKNADINRFPKMATAEGKQQNCANCRLYTGKPDEEWGPCAIFPGKAVNRSGWCAAWAKNG